MRPNLSSSVAAFYARSLALHDGGVLEWTPTTPPRRIDFRTVHVTVARDTSYAIDTAGRLLTWSVDSPDPRVSAIDIAHVTCGESGVLAIRNDGTLMQRLTNTSAWNDVAFDVVHAWVGDSSDYYVTREGRLYVSGLAHRGQYGDGLLTSVAGWKPVAEDVVQVCAHTGHAVLLKSDGTVEGTGGNRFGPLGRHGYGDKADRWGAIFDPAIRIATGARNTLAIRADRSLWLWGEHVGLEPRRVLEDVLDVACGDTHVVARTADDRIWYWAAGDVPRPLAL